MIRVALLCVYFILFSLINNSTVYAFQTITVSELSSPPVLDGSSSDWGEFRPVSVPLVRNPENGFSDVAAVSVMAGIHGESFFLYAQWKDGEENLIHKPFIWDEGEERYIRGPQREDRFSIQFAMEGDYTTQWFSGNEFKADMWHWKSSRTNPAGLAHDKMTIITAEPVKRAYKTTAKNGKTVYLYRPSDAGDKIYTSKRYSKKQDPVMPKYTVLRNTTGSIADVKAKGVWKDGMWHLEIKRLLNTGNDDDLVFEKGRSVKAGIGIFNASETTDHNISDILVFQF